MNKGLIGTIILAGAVTLLGSAGAAAQIWKVVDEDGNVVYTDQKPSDGSAPLDLPELSVIETDYAEEMERAKAAKAADAEAGQPGAKTPRELRSMFRDFGITRPAQEETFWGTSNTVVVSWGSATPFEPGMTARLHVDGQSEQVPPSGNMSVTLDRGQHEVYAELFDARNRRVLTSDKVTFFVKQQSVNFRPGGN